MTWNFVVKNKYLTLLIFKDCAKRPVSQLFPPADIVALGKDHQYESKTVEEDFLTKMKVLNLS